MVKGDVPDERKKAFLKKKFPSLVFLESEWERLHIRIWANSRVYGMDRVHIDAQTVFVYAEEFGLNKVETLELIREIEGEVVDVKKS